MHQVITWSSEVLREVGDEIGRQHARVLVAGAPGGAGSLFVTQLAAAQGLQHTDCWAIGADPGLPLVGLPTTVVLAHWREGSWAPERIEGLATLDAGRFRTPLACAVTRLSRQVPRGALLLVDAPALSRGIPAAELMQALAAAADATHAIALRRAEGRSAAGLLRCAGLQVREVEVPPPGRVFSEEARRLERDTRWSSALQGAEVVRVDLARTEVIGLPAAAEGDDGWGTRVVALLDDDGGTLALGWVEATEPGSLLVRAKRVREGRVGGICVRDTCFDPRSRGLSRLQDDSGGDRGRGDAGRGRAFALAALRTPDVPLEVPPLGSRSAVVPTLVNGVFGDPLLHLRVVQHRQSVLFDLGEAGALPRRIAHQVARVCVTHAHIDHVSGLGWLVRMRVGTVEPCRIVGPPGMAARVAAQVQAFTWNLVGEQGPRFEVDELHGDCLRRYEVRAGREGVARLGDRRVVDDVIDDAGSYRLRAVTLDHHMPILAYSFDLAGTTHVDEASLRARGWAPGPWVGELKHAVEEGRPDAWIALPDGSGAAAGILAEELLEVRPARRLVYVTDIADTTENRERLIAFAKCADVLVCEAAFAETDRARAAATAHLTATACGTIAALAQVGVLVPFHFSARYETDAELVYGEVAAAFGRTWPAA